MTAHEIWVTGEILGCLGDRAEWANDNRDAIDLRLPGDDFARLTVTTGSEYGQFTIHVANTRALLDLDGATSLIEASDMVSERLPEALKEIANKALSQSLYLEFVAALCKEVAQR